MTLASQAPEAPEPHQEKTVSIFAQVRDAARRAADLPDPLTFVEIRALIDAGPLTPGAVRHSFRAELPYCSDQRAEAIWKSLKLKAREPENFVEVITSTTVTDESVPFGFIRVPLIEAAGQEPFTITEHVMLDDELKSVLFIQTDGDFLATNRVDQFHRLQVRLGEGNVRLLATRSARVGVRFRRSIDHGQDPVNIISGRDCEKHEER